jgi:hypothetical protein
MSASSVPASDSLSSGGSLASRTSAAPLSRVSSTASSSWAEATGASRISATVMPA